MEGSTVGKEIKQVKFKDKCTATEYIEYDVERIVEQKGQENGKLMYKVRCCVWLPEETITEKFAELLKQFKNEEKERLLAEMKPPPKKRGRKRKIQPPEGEVHNTIEIADNQDEVVEKKLWRSKRLKENNDRNNTSEFYCKYCEKSFFTEYIFKEHMQDHEDEGIDADNDSKDVDLTKSFNTIVKGKKVEYQCCQCFQLLREKRDAKAHLRVHDGTNPWQCQKCGKHFLRKHKYERHILVHTGTKEYMCEKCQKSFNGPDYLRRHAMYCGTTGLQCTLCDKSFTEKRLLKVHLAIHNGTNDMYCPTCDKHFLRKGSFDNHMAMHDNNQPYICCTCGKGFSVKTEYNVHMKSHLEDMYRCHSCSEVFALPEDLEMHYQMSEICMDIVCAKCDIHFSEVSHLTAHLQVYASNPPGEVYLCRFCQRGFHALDEFSEHYNTFHLAEKPRACLQCEDMFGTETLLLKHTLDVHSEEKLFPCVDCSFGFVDATSLKQHIKSVHDTSFRCLPCNRTFAFKEELTKHFSTKEHLTITDTNVENKNTRNTCFICGRMCLTATELKKHQLVHQRVNFKPQQESIMQNTLNQSESVSYANQGVLNVENGGGDGTVVNEEQLSLMNAQINIDASGNISLVCIAENNKGVINMTSDQQDLNSSDNASLHYVVFDDQQEQVKNIKTPENDVIDSTGLSQVIVNSDPNNESLTVDLTDGNTMSEQAFLALSEMVKQGKVDLSGFQVLGNS